MLNQFIHTQLDNLQEAECLALESLLNESDPVLYACLLGCELPNNQELMPIVDLIKQNYHSG